MPLQSLLPLPPLLNIKSTRHSRISPVKVERDQLGPAQTYTQEMPRADQSANGGDVRLHVIVDRYQRFSGKPAVLERTGESPIQMKAREEQMR
jgi:hypothetical protein